MIPPRQPVSTPIAKAGQRRDLEGERLGRAISREGGEAGRVEPEQGPGRPEPRRQQPDDRRRAEADEQGDIVVHPEDRRADQQVAHGAAADPGHHREEDEGDEGLLLLRRQHRPRRREHRGAGEVEEVEDRAERVGESRREAWPALSTSFQRKLESSCVSMDPSLRWGDEARQTWIGLPVTAIAASLTASECVGWAWQV